MEDSTKATEDEIQHNGKDVEHEPTEEICNDNTEPEQLTNAEVDNEIIDNEQTENEKISTESSPNQKTIKVPTMGSGTLAENIAKEATQIAERMMSKNERVAKEFNGVGVKNQDDSTNAEEEMDHRNYVYVDECPQDSDASPNHTNKKKILFGAKAIIPMNNSELMEKLKQRRQ